MTIMKHWPNGEPIRFYRRDGTPYPEGNDGVLQWGDDMLDLEAKVVRQEVLPNGYKVSTIWLGLDHSFVPEMEPQIFETEVWDPADNNIDAATRRYSTEDDAIVGHTETVNEYTKKD